MKKRRTCHDIVTFYVGFLPKWFFLTIDSCIIRAYYANSLNQYNFISNHDPRFQYRIDKLFKERIWCIIEN